MHTRRWRMYIYHAYTYRKPLYGETRPFECMRDNEIVEERCVLLPNLRGCRREPCVSVCEGGGNRVDCGNNDVTCAHHHQTYDRNPLSCQHTPPSHTHTHTHTSLNSYPRFLQHTLPPFFSVSSLLPHSSLSLSLSLFFASLSMFVILSSAPYILHSPFSLQPHHDPHQRPPSRAV